MKRAMRLLSPPFVSVAKPWLSGLGAHPMAEQFARGRARANAVLEGDFAIDDSPLVAFGLLYATPLVARQVVKDFDRCDFQVVEIVNHDIGRCALAQEATILEARAERRQRAQPPVDLFEGEPLLLAHVLH